MKRNPIVPYILIMVMGLGLIFFLGIKGIGDAKELAKEREGGGEEEVVAFEPEAYANKACITCHGENLEGGGGPSLHGTGLSKDEVADILANGTSGGMPAGLVPADNIDEMAEWVANLK
ncbi:cytochrome c550 [Lederbergia citrea]|uniref:Cytochrome c n=1 Tax=Lederbergia citrea TaxID=2833581 RepID=A0A942Z4I2_9BACI|nr:cytochrome c [Lederbergia citrea]MBS4176310.1 cytochrome c [Lederbergia citrea]MBS4202871.1 cytochrome c [Lederbergia citrea]MBS4222462.1 cytochrome c [Lederbergia citrea]